MKPDSLTGGFNQSFVCLSVCVCAALTSVCVCVSVPVYQLGGYISDVASNMMQVEEHVLWMAQNQARACTRMVQSVERIAELLLTEDNRLVSQVGSCLRGRGFCQQPHPHLILTVTECLPAFFLSSVEE